VPVDGPTTPWRHQAQAYWFCRERPAALLNCGLGTGKSRVVVDLVCSVQEIRRVLILAPKSVVGVWPRMFEAHGSSPVCVYAPTKGTTAKKAKDLSDALGAPGKVVAVLNYEAAIQGLKKGMADLLLRQRWDLVVLDESHKIKAPSGKTSRLVSHLSAARRICLTGTPMPHSPMDVFGQFRFLDPWIYGTSFVAFRNRYAKTIQLPGTSQVMIVGFQNQEELARKMDPITFTARTEDVLDLPPWTDVDREFDLAPAEAKAYKEMQREFVAELKSGVVTAANALVRLLRLAQITSGVIETDEQVKERLGSSKRALLSEVLEECGREPVAVFCRFHSDLDQVRDVATGLGLETLELSGRRNDVPTGRWDRGDVLAVQEQAGGVGVDLTRCRFLCFWSLGYSLGNHEQARGRVWRPGQTRHVSYIYLVARGTVDVAVREALAKKKNVVDYVLGQIDPMAAGRAGDHQARSAISNGKGDEWNFRERT
jgi:SNF2 family DNA or RNA helicase